MKNTQAFLHPSTGSVTNSPISSNLICTPYSDSRSRLIFRSNNLTQILLNSIYTLGYSKYNYSKFILGLLCFAIPEL